MNKLLLFLLCPVLAFSQTAQRWNVAIEPTSGSNFSVVIPNAQVSVCTYNSELACVSPNLVIYSDIALTQRIDQPLSANPAGTYSYYVQAGTHLVEKVCAPYNQCQFYDIYVGSSSAGGGSSLCGPLPGDATSTQCGTNALASLTGTNSNLSGFGDNAVSSLTGENSQDIGVGANAASDLSTVQNLVAIGNNAGSSSTECGDVVGVGDNASSICSGSVEVVGVGDNASSIISTGSSDIVGVGDNTSSNITNSENVIGMGDNAASNITNSENVIGIGNDASSIISTGSSEIIGLGDLSVSNVAAGSDDIIGIGNCAAAGLGAASSDVIQIGHSTLCGYSNTVYTDSIAIGNNQITASHQTILGDPAITQAIIYGDVEINGGTNTVYRCATSGTLPAGALTITSGSCGTTTDTGLRVQ